MSSDLEAIRERTRQWRQMGWHREIENDVLALLAERDRLAEENRQLREAGEDLFAQLDIDDPGAKCVACGVQLGTGSCTWCWNRRAVLRWREVAGDDC